MKKVVVAINLCAVALSASAQFKVQSNGNIAIQTTSTASSPISINCAGNSSTYISCDVTGKDGLSLTTMGNNSGTRYGGQFASTAANKAIGLKGNAQASPTSIGVMGNASLGTKAIGLLGNTSGSTGAGVYGAVNDIWGTHRW